LEELAAVADDMRVLVNDNLALTGGHAQLMGEVQVARHRAEDAEAKVESLQRATNCQGQELQRLQQSEAVCRCSYRNYICIPIKLIMYVY
jgi:hypothetical protein